VNLHKEVAKLEWAGFFDVVIGAQDAARDKPAADPVLLALKDSGIAPSSEVWLVGDSVTDLECAKNAGISAILYGDEGAQTQALLQNFQVLHHVLNHKNLADFLGISLT
jgi:phosphoglycolate phosphatase-like HAD superfamily hydrolase